jgi:hypothetical protein
METDGHTEGQTDGLGGSNRRFSDCANVPRLYVFNAVNYLIHLCPCTKSP